MYHQLILNLSTNEKESGKDFSQIFFYAVDWANINVYALVVKKIKELNGIYIMSFLHS